MPSGFNRERYLDELAKPAIKEKLFALTISEVGEKNESAQRALMETIMNRTDAYGRKTLNATMSYAYYEPFQNGAYNKNLARIRKRPDLVASLEKRLQEVIAGSNDSNYGLHNGSAGVAASAKKTQTVTAKVGGETFSRKDVKAYAALHGAGTIRKESAWYAATKEAVENFKKKK